MDTHANIQIENNLTVALKQAHAVAATGTVSHSAGGDFA